MKCETDDGRWNAIGWFEVEGNTLPFLCMLIIHKVLSVRQDSLVRLWYSISWYPE